MIDSVKFILNGVETAMTQDAVTGEWVATVDAPGVSSWYEPNHKYNGVVTAHITNDLPDVVVAKETDTATVEDFPALGIRVLGTDIPGLTLVTPENDWVFPLEEVSFVWDAIPTYPGIATAALTVNGTAVTAPEPETTETGALRYSYTGEAAGEVTVSFSVTDNDGNTASISTDVGAYSFITDRTEADVDRVTEVAEKVNEGTATAAETDEYNSGDMKGAYNASDMNRVGFGVWHLSRLYWAHGYGDGEITTKRDWRGPPTFDEPTPEQINAYLVAVNTLGGYIPESLIKLSRDNLPEIPENWNALNYQTANDIEGVIIVAIDSIERIINSAQTEGWYAGEIFGGET